MAVNLTVFPLDVSEWQKAVTYSTDIIVGRNGQEVRNALWQDPLLKFNAAFSVRSYADIATLVTFFHGCKGREQSFLVKDWSDFKVDTYTTFAETPNGSRTQFQLIKKYTHATLGTYTRTIKYPKANALTVRVGGTVKTAGTDYTYSTSTGIVTFTTAPPTTTGGSPTVVDFKIDEFYVPCRFDTDELPVEMLSYWVDAASADKSNVNIPEIPIIEVRN